MGIHIKEPCTENWKEMSPTEQGAFCQKCAMEVIDFTQMTSLEIKSILHERFNSGTRVCGRIEKRQMEQLNDVQFQWKTERESFQAIWMYSLLAVFGLSLFSCQSAASREMMEQAKIAGIELLETDSLSLTISENTEDSISTETSFPDSLVATEIPNIFPEVTMGAIWPYEPFENPKIESLIECKNIYVLGDFAAIYGAIGPTEPKSPLIPWVEYGVSPLFTSIPVDKEPQITPHERFQPRPTENERSPVITSSPEDEFKAYLGPMPITQETRLIIEVYTDITLNLALIDFAKKEIQKKEPKYLASSTYALDVGFTNLLQGDYIFYLQSENTSQRIEFTV